MQCLLIEDDLDDQEIFLICLGHIRPDMNCIVLNNAIEALQKFNEDESFAPDVIFLDVNMPKMNGLDCLKELKKIPRLAKTCIYIYSTTSEPSVINKAMELGADDYVIKLPRTAELKEKLLSVLNVCQHVNAKRNSNEGQ